MLLPHTHVLLHETKALHAHIHTPDNDTLKACPLIYRPPHTHTVRYTQLGTQADTRLTIQERMELGGGGACRIGLGRRTRVPAGHHFLLLLGAVGGEVLDDDVRILEEHITDGLDRT